MDMEKDFILHAIKQEGKLGLYSSRDLQPMEILEVTANVLKLVPDEMRQMALDVVSEALDNKTDVLVS